MKCPHLGRWEVKQVDPGCFVLKFHFLRAFLWIRGELETASTLFSKMSWRIDGLRRDTLLKIERGVRLRLSGSVSLCCKHWKERGTNGLQTNLKYQLLNELALVHVQSDILWWTATPLAQQRPQIDLPTGCEACRYEFWMKTRQSVCLKNKTMILIKSTRSLASWKPLRWESESGFQVLKKIRAGGMRRY